MVTKEGNYKTKLPTQYRSNSRFGLHVDYETGTETKVKYRKCPACDKGYLKPKVDTSTFLSCNKCPYTLRPSVVK